MVGSYTDTLLSVGWSSSGMSAMSSMEWSGRLKCVGTAAEALAWLGLFVACLCLNVHLENDSQNTDKLFSFIKYWPWRRLALLVEILANKFCPSAAVPALQSIWFYNTFEWRLVRAFLDQEIRQYKPSSRIIRCVVSCILTLYISSNFIVLRELSLIQKSPVQIIWIFAVRMEGAPQSEFEVAFSASQVCWVDFVMYENDSFFKHLRGCKA